MKANYSSRFGDNLDAILTTFADARVPVIVSDIASNIMFPPFVTDSLVDGRSAVAFDARMRAGVAAHRYADMVHDVDALGASGVGHPLPL